MVSKSQTESIFAWTSQWLKAQGLHHEASVLTESTNDSAKKNAFEDPPITVYLADEQSHGRGREDRTWTSPPPGSALLASWSYELIFPPQQLSAPLIGLQTYRAVTTVWPKLPWSLKAPNDLFLGDHKVAGLLVESISRGSAHRLIIGFGLNVFASPKSVEIATCLADHLKQPLNEKQWQGFLNHLNRNLKMASEQVGLTRLPEEVCSELLAALKRHPAAQQLQAVTHAGDLVYKDRTISWHQL